MGAFFKMSDLMTILPEIIIFVIGTVVLILDLFLKRDRKEINIYVTLVGLIIALYSTFPFRDKRVISFNQMFILDPFANFFKIILIISAILVVIISIRYLKSKELFRGEYYALLLYSVVGMMFIASANDMIVFFIGLELMAITLYVLTGFDKLSIQSNEAAIKYFLLGVFSSGILVYGISILYGITGTTNLTEILNFMSTKGWYSNYASIISIILITVGFGFKVVAVPFHFWAPDVYQGSPVPVASFIASAPKAAVFPIMIRLYLLAVPNFDYNFVPLLTILSILSMTVGNIIALAQRSIKRMLAYSSISHCGYVLMAIVAAAHTSDKSIFETSIVSIMVYAFAYILMKIGAFAILISTKDKDTLEDFKGLAIRSPLAAFLMTVFLLSLIGIPPTVGFLGKFLVFKAVISADLAWLALIGVLNAVLAAFYYIRVMIYMYAHKMEGELAMSNSSSLLFALTVIVVLIFALGLFPDIMINYASLGAEQLR